MRFDAVLADPPVPSVGDPAGLAPSERDASSLPAPLHIAALTKRYGGRPVLDAITIGLRPGEIVAIAGVNGAGKTTLLRCLLDFAHADSGEVRLFGVDSRDPAARARLAFLPERFVPPAYLTGHEVLTWMAGLHGIGWSRERSQRAIERFAMPAEALDRPVRQFSKGMTQKLGLVAVLASGKPLCMLDEPMSGLDPQARRFVAEALAQARADGTALLLTSHSMTDIDRLCDRVAVVHAGRLRWFGTPAELKSAHGSADLESAFLACIA
jgi:ABC-type multidrug transport system ATPase subunit